MTLQEGLLLGESSLPASCVLYNVSCLFPACLSCFGEMEGWAKRMSQQLVHLRCEAGPEGGQVALELGIRSSRELQAAGAVLDGQDEHVVVVDGAFV